MTHSLFSFVTQANPAEPVAQVRFVDLRLFSRRTPNPVIPSGATRLFLAHGSGAPVHPEPRRLRLGGNLSGFPAQPLQPCRSRPKPRGVILRLPDEGSRRTSAFTAANAKCASAKSTAPQALSCFLPTA